MYISEGTNTHTSTHLVDTLWTPFLPRDAMRKRGLCCRPVSVRLSVCALVHCIQTTEDIVKLLVRPGSPVTLVF